MRSGAEVARLAHNQEVVINGANPTSAILLMKKLVTLNSDRPIEELKYVPLNTTD